MNREKKLTYNTISSLTKQFVVLICGFILPRLFLTNYGSTVNGLVSSITQFLSLAAIFDAGLGVVIEASLFKPLAKSDTLERDKILTSAQKLYNRFVQILFVYVVGLALLYPFKVLNSFGYVYTLTLIIAISISSFGQYCFGVTRSVLLSADQRSYINNFSYIGTTILNTIVAVVLIKFGCSIQVVKLASSLVFTLRPILLIWYVKRKYNINWHTEYSKEPIKQKWNGLAQHISALILANTDIVVLTLFSTLQNVSIYSVYFLVINGIKEVISAASIGIRSLMGDMLAKNEIYLLAKKFNSIEWIFHTITTLLFTITAILICPFIKVYTLGVNDANYYVPVFAVLLCMAYAVNCLRTPYQSLIMAAGHFKQTQASSIIEAVINIVVSIIVVSKFGIVGVACGTLVAMLYRTVYLSWYLSHNILMRPLEYFFKNLMLDLVSMIVMMVSTNWIIMAQTNYLLWIVMALKVGSICLIECIIINMIFYPKEICNILKK